MGLSRSWMVVTLIGSAIGGAVMHGVDVWLFREGWDWLSSGIVLGILFGAIIGSLQGLVLRRHIPEPSMWMIANIAAGMLLGLALPAMGRLSAVAVPLFG